MTAGAALGVVGLLAIAPAAALTASALPQPLAASTVEVPSATLEEVTRIRQVPVGLPKGTVIGSLDDVRPFAVAAIGPEGADRLIALLTPAADGYTYPDLDPSLETYPYRFGEVDRILDGVPEDRLALDGTSLGAALTMLAVSPDSGTLDFSAGRLAFSVLDHAREAGGGCDAQLNLLALVASDPEIGDGSLRGEADRTARACPGDPTGGWLASQHWIHQVSGEFDGTDLDDVELAPILRARKAVAALVAAFPRDPGVLATLGDARLVEGEYLGLAQPFTSRRAYQDAAEVFGRLLRAGSETAAARLGAARAALGLRRPAEAAPLATAVAKESSWPAAALQVAALAQERARQFGAAVTTARQLDTLGTRAYPPPTAVIPVGDPLSIGFDTLTRASVDLLGGGQGGGGVVADEGFVPVFRPAYGLTTTDLDCPDWLWRRDALLSGDTNQVALAVRDWPDEFASIDPPSHGSGCPGGDLVKLQLDHTMGQALPDDMEEPKARARVEDLFDQRQNLFRWAGDVEGARRETLEWARLLGEHTALAQVRLGEIDYLLKRYDDAAAHFAQAAVRWRIVDSGNDLALDEALLAQGAALLKSRRTAQAVEVLRPLVLEGAQGYGYQSTLDDGYSAAQSFATLSYYAATLLGDHELAAGELQAADDDFSAALLWAETLHGAVHLDAARNSAAVAALGTGDTARAAELSRSAVAGDPASPVYLMTSGDVALRAGQVTNAVRQGRAALTSDHTAYPAANNVGVLLARQGHLEQASRMLRGAVAAAPDYGLGWFNLGIVEGRRGPLHVIASQGALGRAAVLDAHYADRDHRLVLDTATYRTDLDISKPIPAGWSFAASQRKAPVVTLGLFAAVLAVVGLVSLRDPSSSGAREWLENLGTRLSRVAVARRFRRPWWAVLATVGAFLLAFWRDPLWPWTGIAYAVCLVALVGAGMVARGLVARRRVGGVVHGTWSPGVVVGLVSGAFGVPIAPLPVVRAPVKDARVAMAAPLTLALLSLALLLEAALLHTPLTTALCVAAFIMAGSVLLPITPLDGSRAGAAGVVGAAGLLGAVLLLGLGLV